MEDPGYGDIDGIERAVREYPFVGTKKDEAERELGYFLNNAPGALPLVPLPRPVRRLRRHRGQLQEPHRRTPEAVRNALDAPRRRRHHHRCR